MLKSVRQFFTWTSTHRLALYKKDLDWKDVISKKDLDWKDVVSDWRDVVSKKDLDWKDVISKKDVEVAVLMERLKVSNLNIMIEKNIISVRAAVETIINLKYPKTGTEHGIQLYMKQDDKLKPTYENLCGTFNCIAYKDKVPPSLYHTLSNKIHGGGRPFQCYTSDRTLSKAEWALVISIFKLNLPQDGFKVFDSDDIEMEI